MRKKIGRKIYDTEKSEYIGRNAEGFFGDPSGFEEEMYKKGVADFFLLVSGGPESQYPEEDIIPLELEDAREWLVRNCGDEVAQEYITQKDEDKASGADKKKAPKKKAAKKAASKTTKKSTKTTKDKK